MNEQHATTPGLSHTEQAGVQPLLEAHGLSKAYGQVQAASEIDFTLLPHEVVGIVGDNGAGKSTFIKMLSGAVVPDTGTITIEGQSCRFRNPTDARRAGIETVFQELAVVPFMDVEANMFLGRELLMPGPLGWGLRLLRQREMRKQAQEQLSSLQINMPSMRQSVETLSGGQRQSVAVARAVAWGRKIIIMDEPTAALGVQESARVVDLIKRIRERGLAIILISHNLPHIFEVTDRVVVFRRGRKVGERQTSRTNMDEVVSLITGASTDEMGQMHGHH